MPKERVFSTDAPYTEASSARSVIGVTWSRDGYAQVFTELFNDDLKVLAPAVLPAGVTATGDISEYITRIAEGAEASRRKTWADGFYVTLDRNGINDLIRHLRRARDQAFGRDE